MEGEKIAALRSWMIQKGCLIHKNLTIPSNINGVQGISTNAPIPEKTLIIAVPSKLILTVTKCYNEPTLKKLFLANDDLFDYQASEDAQFNVLCVFMMYHKINIDKSEWKQYLQTIAEPETAVDWQHSELKGLNKSLIEQVIHIRRQCTKLQDDLVKYLHTRKQFKEVPQEILKSTFHYCYRSVMTRCFGYYFNQACLIPIADLINHGCDAIDHQLLHLNFQKQKQFYEGYVPRKDKIDCSLIGLPKPQILTLPFRQRFLVKNKIIENDPEVLCELTRSKINGHLYEWNKRRIQLFPDQTNLDNLQFCSENEEEDNDTDQEVQVEQERQLQHCKTVQQNQMNEFMKNYVVIENYSEIQKRLDSINSPSINHEDLEAEKQQNNKSQTKDPIQIQININNVNPCEQNEARQQAIQSFKRPEPEYITQQKPAFQSQQNQPIPSSQNQKPNEKPNIIPKEEPQLKNIQQVGEVNVPIKMIQDESSDDESQQEWGLTDTAYFTMSTSSCVAANREIYNSYGSRTNKFLLIWYGFVYENNLYDSVSFRLQVQFTILRPASQIVLDSYIGGQGLSFRKNDKQIVKDTQISKQFRLKRSNICIKLITFLRLYLMNFYQQKDLYKLFVTFPASLEYEIFVFQYYLDIIASLYERYPLEIIQELEQQYNSLEKDPNRYKIKYKIIYLTEQRKIIDLNLFAAETILKVLKKCKKNCNKLQRHFWQDIPIEILRVIRKYLYEINKYHSYIIYEQAEPIDHQKNQQTIENKQIQKVEQNLGQDQWEDDASDELLEKH